MPRYSSNNPNAERSDSAAGSSGNHHARAGIRGAGTPNHLAATRTAGTRNIAGSNNPAAIATAANRTPRRTHRPTVPDPAR